jgi:hypothetical protein
MITNETSKTYFVQQQKIFNRSRYFIFVNHYIQAALKSTQLNTVIATTWSVCSRAKPTAHTGFGISFFVAILSYQICYQGVV